MEHRGQRSPLEHGREVGVDQDLAVRCRDAAQRRSEALRTAGNRRRDADLDELQRGADLERRDFEVCARRAFCSGRAWRRQPPAQEGAAEIPEDERLAREPPQSFGGLGGDLAQRQRRRRLDRYWDDLRRCEL